MSIVEVNMFDESHFEINSAPLIFGKIHRFIDCGSYSSPMLGKRKLRDFFIEYLTQNLIFHIKSHVTKYLWVLRISNTKIKTSDVTKLKIK